MSNTDSKRNILFQIFSLYISMYLFYLFLSIRMFTGTHTYSCHLHIITYVIYVHEVNTIIVTTRQSCIIDYFLRKPLHCLQPGFPTATIPCYCPILCTFFAKIRAPSYPQKESYKVIRISRMKILHTYKILSRWKTNRKKHI